MAQGFELGDKVEAVDDVTRGRVVAIDGDQITVESRDGFLIPYSASELLNISGQERLSVSPLEVAKAKAHEESLAPRKKPAPKKKERNTPRMEVDLHVGQLLPSTRGMSKYDILNHQLETARRQLEFAMEKRIQRVVFIHGVGEGIL